MIKKEQVKVMPLCNPNFYISNKDELCDLIQGVPIIVNYNYEEKEPLIAYDCKIIGMVAQHGSVLIENNMLTSDIYIMDEIYKDYEFVNYECDIDMLSKKDNIAKIKRISAIVFGKNETRK